MDDQTRDNIKRQIIIALERRKRRRTDDDPKPVRAIALASLLQLNATAGRESKRLAVRKMIAEMRSEGIPIISNLKGYWLGELPEDFAIYQAFFRRLGLSHLVTAAAIARTDAASIADGQGLLFPDHSAKGAPSERRAPSV